MSVQDENVENLLSIIEIQSREINELEEEVRKLEVENLTLKSEILEHLDKYELTVLYNRAVSDEAYHKSNTVIMCDIDDFKALNDTYGHNFGDMILVKIAEILKSSVRSTDYVVRWGGEEFVIFIDNSNIEVATILAERIRRKTENLEGEILENGIVIPLITMSFGVSKLHSSDSLTSDIEMVDKALYNSKRNGKNIITINSEKDDYVLKKKL